MIESILSIGWGGLFQIAVLSVAFYYIFIFFQGTRGAQVLVGMLLLLAGMLALTYVLDLAELHWLLRNLSVYLAVAVLVIFQPEFRRALAELGRQPVFSASADRREMIDCIVQAVEHLSDHKVGALIAIEREIGTRAIRETGIKIDAPVVSELLASIFFPHTPLHDGGVIIQGGRILMVDEKRAMMERLGTTEAVIDLAAPLTALPPEIAAFPVELAEGGLRLIYRGGNGEGGGRADVAQLAQALTRAGIGYISLDIHDSSLEDICVGLLGQQEVPA